MSRYSNLLIKNGRFYNACGNRFLVISLKENVEFSKNISLRKDLIKFSLRQKIDSVLILQGDPKRVAVQGYHCKMDVFEPRSNTFSTMCGNGIRAVCSYWRDQGFILEDNRAFLIQTKSGIRKVYYIGNNIFKAEMGELTTRGKDTKRYATIKNLDVFKNIVDVIFVKAKKRQIPAKIDNVILGLTGNYKNGKINGEPHLVFFINQAVGLKELKNYTTLLGMFFTRCKALFPFEINTSVVSYHDDFTAICTYERGVYYVTKSCGTAATVAGGYILQQRKKDQITIATLGGTLKVEKNNKTFYLVGEARSSGK